MRPEPSLPRTSTPPPVADELPELTLEESGAAPVELGACMHKMNDDEL
jgi:hypothetical protein